MLPTCNLHITFAHLLIDEDAPVVITWCKHKKNCIDQRFRLHLQTEQLHPKGEEQRDKRRKSKEKIKEKEKGNGRAKVMEGDPTFLVGHQN